MHDLTPEQLKAIVVVGVANHWDASDVVQDAKRTAAKDAPSHATVLLAAARNLEKSDRPEQALKSYRELVSKYPNSAEAKTATERIKALSAGACHETHQGQGPKPRTIHSKIAGVTYRNSNGVSRQKFIRNEGY